MLATSRFEPRAESAAQARRWVRQTLVDIGVPYPVFDDASLLVSELVTNAVLHARTQVEVRIVRADDLLRMEVKDFNPRPPSPVSVPVDAASGRGLHIVAEVASRWGVRSNHDGKAVWFDLALPSPAGTGAP